LHDLQALELTHAHASHVMHCCVVMFRAIVTLLVLLMHLKQRMCSSVLVYMLVLLVLVVSIHVLYYLIVSYCAGETVTMVRLYSLISSLLVGSDLYETCLCMCMS
jgi:hypothetical protein